MDMDRLLYLKWVTNQDLLQSTGNSAQCYVAAWMGEGFGGEWIHVYVWLSPFRCSPETITTLLISHTPIQNVVGVKKIENFFLECSLYHILGLCNQPVLTQEQQLAE